MERIKEIMRECKIIMQSLISVIIIVMMVVNLLAPLQVEAVAADGGQMTENDFLKVKDGYLKNKNGDIVVLRGVNAGGWLVQESWMCPVNGEDRKWANLDTINTLKDRGFTNEQIQTLFDTYQDNWFTEYDIDKIQSTGANCIRVPFWYRNFMSDEDGTWITGSDLDNNPGIKRLDWIIEECGKRGMYVILDCHGAAGGQSMDHCCGTLCKNELYDSPKNRAILKDLWSTIANRYKDSPVVAAYDILNEPQNNLGYDGENAWTPGSEEALSRTYSVYDEMYQAIRAVDANHVISMEAIWEGDCLPDPAEYGWSNLLYQMHIYDTSKDMIDKRIGELEYFQKRYGVAVYSGEFNCDNFESYAMEQFNKTGISWTTWAYKGSKQSIGNTWFLYVQYLTDADVTVDSYETILEKWGSVLRTVNFETNNNFVTRAIGTYTAEELSEPVLLPQAIEIPAKIEAEDYAFMSGIQTESTSDTGGGENVGYVDTGDWLEYYINVPEDGEYHINLRIASQNGSLDGLQIKIGTAVFATVTIPATGDWQQWETLTVPVTLSKGKQYLKFYANNANYNINWFEISKDSAGEVTTEPQSKPAETSVTESPATETSTAVSPATERPATETSTAENTATESAAGDTLMTDNSTVETATAEKTTSAENPENTTIVTAPPRTKVKTATKKKSVRKVKLSIKKVTGANGYKIQFSKTKKFKKVFVKKIVKKAKVTISNRKLKKAGKLYVRVKAYKLDGNKKIWAKKWSKIKKVQIKR